MWLVPATGANTPSLVALATTSARYSEAAAPGAGIAAVAVHGRTKEQGYSGVADWDVIAQTAAAVRIPVIGNGDLATCGMVRLEVERGLRIEKIHHRMAAFFDVLINIPTTNKIWKESAALAWSLDRSGITLPSQDILIATCAQEIGAAILTDDNHLEIFQELQILKPSKEFAGW